MIKNNRTAMNAYKKTREKHGGDRPRCVVCGGACPGIGNQKMERAAGDTDTGGNKEIGVKVWM